MKETLLVTDGGSKGNPGPMNLYCYYAIEVNGHNTITHRYELEIGVGTNNESEYLAVLLGVTCVLEKLKALGVDANMVKLSGVSDSQLVVKHLNGEFELNAPNLKPYYTAIRKLLNLFGSWSYTWASRDIVNVYLGLE